MVPQERPESQIAEIILVYKGKRGSKPTIKTAETDEKKERWYYPTPPGKLTAPQKKRLLGCILQQMIKVIFTTHIYEFDGQLYLQLAGGPMGLRSSGPLSRIFMDKWMEDMEEMAILNPVKYERLKVHDKSKYVDDVQVFLDALKPGTRWCPNEKTFIWSPENAQETTRTEREQNTMRQYASAASDAIEC